MSALHIALLKGYNETAQMLLSAGASPVQRAGPLQSYDSPEMAPLKISKQPLGMASASSLVDKKTLRQLYDAIMNDSGRPNYIQTEALASAICGQQPQKLEALLDLGAVDRPYNPGGTPRVPGAMAAAIDTEQEVMVQVLLSRKDQYHNMLQSAKHYAGEHLMELGRLDRVSSKYTATKRIIAMLDQEIARRERA